MQGRQLNRCNPYVIYCRKGLQTLSLHNSHRVNRVDGIADPSYRGGCAGGANGTGWGSQEWTGGEGA